MQQWHAPAAALRVSPTPPHADPLPKPHPHPHPLVLSPSQAAGILLDVLYVTDPSNSFYLQDPSYSWAGLTHYANLVTPHAQQYPNRVLMVGSSMGATACLQHAALATRALAFAPRIDLELSHGAFVPQTTRAESLAAIRRSLECLPPAAVGVHCGGGNFVDMAQVATVRDAASVVVVEHATFHHNVPAFLEGQSELVPLLRGEVARLLLGEAERRALAVADGPAHGSTT